MKNLVKNLNKIITDTVFIFLEFPKNLRALRIKRLKIYSDIVSFSSNSISPFFIFQFHEKKFFSFSFLGILCRTLSDSKLDAFTNDLITPYENNDHKTLPANIITRKVSYNYYFWAFGR